VRAGFLSSINLGTCFCHGFSLNEAENDNLARQERSKIFRRASKRTQVQRSMIYLAWFSAFLAFAFFAVFGLMEVVRMWIELDEVPDEEDPW
jgi:hypothetical protein